MVKLNFIFLIFFYIDQEDTEDKNKEANDDLVFHLNFTKSDINDKFKPFFGQL